MRPRRHRIALAVVWLAAALAAVAAPAVVSARAQDGSCGDLPSVWCRVAP